MKLLAILLFIHLVLMARTLLRSKRTYKTCYNLGSTKGYCIDYVRRYKEGNIFILTQGYQPITPISGTGHYRPTKKVLTANFIRFLLCDAVYIHPELLNERKGFLFGVYAIFLYKRVLTINH